jgi:hypothetical protein
MYRNMAKKCVPGVMCIENMTLFVLILLSISVGYLYYTMFVKPQSRRQEDKQSSPSNTIILSTPPTSEYASPPLNTIDIRGPIQLPPQAPLGVGVPVNIRTSTANTPYRQMGILTKNVRDGRGTEPLILPLFGRNLLNGRDKWQYYTAANSGFHAKLPISVNGRSCTGEYGCDNVSNGDTVYVEGYDETFRATIYENATLNYIPF